MRVAQSVRRQVARWRSQRWLLAGVVALALLVLVLALATRVRASDPQALERMVGQPAPVVRVSQENHGQRESQSASIGGATGHPQLLVYFFTLCPHCLGEVSAIQSDAEAHAFGDAREMYIDSPGERPDIVDAYAQRVGLRGPVLLDTSSRAATAYHVSYYPSMVLVDAHGIVRDVWYGEVAPTTLANAVAALSGR